MSHTNAQHILVTGGAGFIGSHLVEYHLRKGDKVHAVDDLSTGSMDNVTPFLDNDNFRFTQSDVLVWSDLNKVAAWADRIYHMAAMVGVFRVLAEPIKCLATNIAGCERMLRAATAGGWKPQIVVASTAEVYGREAATTTGTGVQRPAVPPSAAAADFPGFREDEELSIGSTSIQRWNYPISKITNEALGLSYGQAFGMRVMIARLFNAIGPRQTGRYGMVVPRFVEQAVTGKPITVHGDGSQTRSFCDVRDTVRMLDMLISSPDSAHQIVNVGNNHEISIQALAEMIKARAGSQSEIVHLTYEEAYSGVNVETLRRKPDLTKLFKLTDYRHQWRLEKTVDDLVERQRQYKKKGD